MNQRDFRVIGILALFVAVLLSINFATAATNVSITNISIVASNISNGTSWVKGWTNITQTFIFNISGNATTLSNITNFTITNTNLTFYSVSSNLSGGNCTAPNSAYVLCNVSTFAGGNATLPLIYLTMTYQTPSAAYEMNHTLLINVSTNESGPAFASNWTRWNIAVDGVAPTVALPSYTNATIIKNTSQLTLNVSAIDTGSGLTSSFCFVNINGTNQSFAVSSGWCNFTQGNLTGLIDGINKIIIYVNDTVGNSGLNNTFWVWTDTTVPTAVTVCSPSTINAGNSFPCSCGGADSATNNTGLNSTLTVSSSTSPDGTSRPVGLGLFTYSCSVTDLAGNSASLSTTYSVEGLPGPVSSAAASVAAAITSIISSQIFSEINPGTVSTMTNFDVSTGVKQIQIEVNNPAQNVAVTVTKYSSKPSAISIEKSGKIYQYIQIKVDNVTGKLNKAIVTTEVNKSWASQNNLDKSNISLFKFNDTISQWVELPTTYLSEDNTYYYYATNLTSFSYFAIAGKSIVSGETSGTASPPATTDLTWLWIAIGAVILAVAAFVIIKKKK